MLSYAPGAVLPCERAGTVGSEQRSIEFKRLDCPFEDIEEPFISRCAPFVIACLNARINGTIYFGVAGNEGTIVSDVEITKNLNWIRIN